jgi:hypothetical protein
LFGRFLNPLLPKVSSSLSLSLKENAFARVELKQQGKAKQSKANNDRPMLGGRCCLPLSSLRIPESSLRYLFTVAQRVN